MSTGIALFILFIGYAFPTQVLAQCGTGATDSCVVVISKNIWCMKQASDMAFMREKTVAQIAMAGTALLLKKIWRIQASSETHLMTSTLTVTPVTRMTTGNELRYFPPSCTSLGPVEPYPSPLQRLNPAITQRSIEVRPKPDNTPPIALRLALAPAPTGLAILTFLSASYLTRRPPSH